MLKLNLIHYPMNFRVKSLFLITFAIIAACHSEIEKQAPDLNREVYVCKSRNARRYHLIENCHALKRCSRDIEKMSEEKASKIGMSLCGHED